MADESSPFVGDGVSEELKRLFDEGTLSEEAYQRGLELSVGEAPEWRAFLEYVLLFLGIALALSGVIFFFAYNWSSLGKFAKLGLLEAGIAAAAWFAWNRGLDKLSGKASLMVGIVLIGPLLGVFGQTYQTGADPYQLFLGWSLLALGWVVVSRFAAAWYVLFVLVCVTVPLFSIQELGMDKERPVLLALFALHVVAFFVWEFVSERKATGTQDGEHWMQTKFRWLPRVLFVQGLCLVSFLAISVILRGHSELFVSTPDFVLLLPLYIGWVGVSVWLYQFRRQDVLLLACLAVSLIAVSMAVVGNMKLRGLWSFFILSLVVIIEASLAAYWLRGVHRHANESKT